MNKKIVYILIFTFFIITNCKSREKRTYDIMSAPKSLSPIADYENIFSKKEYSDLKKRLIQIEQRFNVKVRIITSVSFNKITVEKVLYKKILNIFRLTNNEKLIIFEFSEKERRFSYTTSKIVRDIINDEKLGRKIALISSKYFNSRKYFQAFKEMIDEIEKELQRNTI